MDYHLVTRGNELLMHMATQTTLENLILCDSAQSQDCIHFCEIPRIGQSIKTGNRGVVTQDWRI